MDRFNKHSRLFGFLLIAFFFFNFTMKACSKPAKISLPPSGYLYHGVYPGPEDLSGRNLITLKSLKLYETAVRKKAAWVYFLTMSQGEDFPMILLLIQKHGSIPFIRSCFVISSTKYQGKSLYPG